MSQPTSHAALVASLSPEVLALLAASYGKRSPDEVVERIVVRNAPKASKPSKLAAVKAAKLEASDGSHAAPVPSADRPPMVVIDLPKVGTLDARSFLIAMRNATTRDAQIVAIAAYCGYDRGADHGTQDMTARMAAQRALRGIKAAPMPIHSAVATVKGYVAGIPDGIATKVGDLLARERLAAEAIGEHEMIAKDDNASPADRHYHAQLVIVETARLVQIRADLAALGVTSAK